jgi:pimeloyl-ACP methyl ester carboxylesterase
VPKLLTAALLLLLLIPAAPARAAAKCPRGAQCGKVTVPLDRSGQTPGTLGLAYARFAATGTRTGTLVVLSGGPGEAAIPLVKAVAPIFKGLRGAYDIVYVDQRGTGQSGAVDCLTGKVAPDRLAPACAKALGAAAPFMTTAATAEDLENLRTALGADRLTLLGVSYGTHVAREYARLHPDRTAAVVLDSTVGPHWLDGLDRPDVNLLARVLGEVCGGECGVPDARAALLAAGNRLLHGSLRVPLVVSAKGRIGHARLSEAVLYALLVSSDISPEVRDRLPGAIAALAVGDGQPLMHLIAVEVHSLFASAQDLLGVNFARHLATACLERQFPWTPDSPVAGRKAALKTAVAQLGEGAFAPFGSKTVLANAETEVCAQWPAFPPPPAVPAGAEPDVPVLILSGREDLRTPLEDAQAVAATYPRATLVPVAGIGHSVLVNDGGGCSRRALVAFLSGQPVIGCDGQAATRSRQAVEPIIPRRLRPGHSAEAVALTLSGVMRDLALGAVIARWTPGLRAGTFRLGQHALLLSGVEWVHGVKLTGTLLGKHDRITISGKLHGRLTGRRGRLAGRLDGRRASFDVRRLL